MENQERIQETCVEHQVVPSGCPWPKVQSAQEL